MKKRLLPLLALLCLLTVCLTVPAGAIDESSPEVARGTCGENLTWKLGEDGLLTISGTGDMENYTGASATEYAPWEAHKADITAISLPEGLTSIGTYAFYGLEHVTSVMLPESIVTVGDRAFYSCSGLTSVKFSGNLEQIGKYVFYGCDALTTATINADGPYSIDFGAFSTSGLTHIKLSGGVTLLDRAFAYADNLTTVEFMGDPPASIHKNAFQNISATCRYPADNTNWDYDIMLDYGGDLKWATGDIIDCGRLADGYVWTLSEDYTLTLIGSGDMDDLSSDTTHPWYAYRDTVREVVLPEGMTRIGSCAFYGFNAVSSIDLPESLTAIGASAFEGWRALTAIEFPENLASLGAHIFYGSAVAEITFTGDAPAFASPTFNGVTAIATYPASKNWPADALQDYHGDITWVSDSALATGKCGVNLAWVLDENDTLTISGTGDMDHYAYSTVPWADYRTSVKAVVLEEGVTSIGNYAFNGMTALTSVSVAATVTSVGEFAFMNCTKLPSVTIPAAVKSIGQYAFACCSDLRSVTLSKGLETIGNSAFYNCSGLQSINLPSTLTSIGSAAFAYCNNLTSLAIPEGITTIEAETFSQCHALTDLELPEGLVTIGDSAFHTTSLTTLVLPDTLETLDASAFANGSALTAVVIPADLGYIAYSAFEDCATLADVYFRGSEAEWYALLGTDSLNIFQPDTEIHFDAAAIIIADPQSLTVAPGGTAAFTVKTLGSGHTYQWQVQTSEEGAWENISGAETDTLSFTADATQNGYHYRCLVSRDGKTAKSDFATLTVEAPFSIIGQPGDRTATAGNTVKFSVSVDNPSGVELSYQWQYKAATGTNWYNSGASSATTDTLTVTAQEKYTGYQYHCVVTDSAGKSVTSEPATLTVESMEELAILTQPEDTFAVVGDKAIFSVEAQGTGLTYQWQYLSASSSTWKNTTFSGNKTAILTVTVKDYHDGYRYRCLVTDAAGETAKSDPAALTVCEELSVGKPYILETDEGDVFMKVAAKGTGLRYQWQYKTSGGSWAATSRTGNKTNALDITTLKTAYTFRCRVTDIKGDVVYSGGLSSVREVFEDEPLFVKHFEAAGSASDSDVVTWAYFADGSEAEITVSKMNGQSVTAEDLDGIELLGYATGWYEYAECADGTYSMQRAEDQIRLTASAGEYVLNYSEQKYDILDGTYDSRLSTSFLVLVDDNLYQYTGAQNAPVIVAGDDTTVRLVHDDETALFVFIDLRDGSIVSDDADTLFLLEREATGNDADAETYGRYRALVNGTETVVRVYDYITNSALGAGYLLRDAEYTDGDITDAVWITETTAANREDVSYDTLSGEDADYSGSTLELCGIDFYLDDDCSIYVIEGEDFTIRSAKVLSSYVNNGTISVDGAAVTGVMNDDGDYTALYIVLA